MPLPGANVAGGEFNAGKSAAVYSHDYIYPSSTEIALLKRLGLKLMRVPFRWERVQRAPRTPLDNEELARLDETVRLAMAAGITTILDLHNFGQYGGVSLGDAKAPSGALSDLWQRLAEHFKDRRTVVFGLMNEPNDINVRAWAAIARDTLEAIRSTGAANLVLVPGTHWDGAHSWLASDGKDSNASALLSLARDDRAVVFEVHQYFDDNYSGTAETCGAAARVPSYLQAVSEWAARNHVRLFLGEFGVSKRLECVEALDDALAVIENNRDVWYGWTYWAAGAWWGNYPFNIQASNGHTPQGAVLEKRATALITGCRAPS